MPCLDPVRVELNLFAGYAVFDQDAAPAGDGLHPDLDDRFVRRIDVAWVSEVGIVAAVRPLISNEQLAVANLCDAVFAETHLAPRKVWHFAA